MGIDETMKIEHIKKAIQDSETQSIPYSKFMELALYHPEHGYYMKSKEKIGKSGDFYTSSSVSPIFAEVLATVFVGLMESKLVKPMIVEFGAGNGSFAKQVLQTWREKSPQTFEKGNYYIVETSPHHKELIQEAVKPFNKVTILESLHELKQLVPDYQGIIFSNEFFDAFPIDIIEKRDGELFEVHVTTGQTSELEEQFRPLEEGNNIRFLKEYQITVKEGFRYEIPIPMCSFIHDLGRWMMSGIVFTIDYGYTDEEWQLPFHREGSIRGYYKHQLIKNPLEHVGDMDITTHIHFDKLIKAGERVGLDHYATYRQDEYLLKAGILKFLEEHQDTNPFSEKSKRNRAIRSLLMQGGISSSFHCLIQTKNINQKEIEKIT